MSNSNSAILVIALLLTSSLLVVLSSNDTIAQAKKNLSSTSSSSHRHTTTRASRTAGRGGTRALLPLSSRPAQSPTPASRIRGSNNSAKVVMINFDDGWKSQFLYAKPILDQYGFKASFFIVCGKVATEPYWMTWPQITGLKNDGMDIESHTMTLPSVQNKYDNLKREIGVLEEFNYDISRSE